MKDKLLLIQKSNRLYNFSERTRDVGEKPSCIGQWPHRNEKKLSRNIERLRGNKEEPHDNKQWPYGISKRPRTNKERAHGNEGQTSGLWIVFYVRI
jgi:hypothetical protein